MYLWGNVSFSSSACVLHLSIGVGVQWIGLKFQLYALCQYLIMEQLINCLDVCDSVTIPAVTHEMVIQQF